MKKVGRWWKNTLWDSWKPLVLVLPRRHNMQSTVIILRVLRAICVFTILCLALTRNILTFIVLICKLPSGADSVQTSDLALCTVLQKKSSAMHNFAKSIKRSAQFCKKIKRYAQLLQELASGWCLTKTYVCKVYIHICIRAYLHVWLINASAIHAFITLIEAGMLASLLSWVKDLNPRGCSCAKQVIHNLQSSSIGQKSYSIHYNVGVCLEFGKFF